MSVPTKRRPTPHPAQASAPSAAPAAAAEAEDAPLSPTPVYRGDYYGLLIWFGGAIILAALHVIDVVYWWFHR